MDTVSFHDKPGIWQKLTGPAAQRRKTVSYCVYSYDAAGHWKKHENISTPQEAMEFARHLVADEKVMRAQIKKVVRDPENGKSVELDFKILS